MKTAIEFEVTVVDTNEVAIFENRKQALDWCHKVNKTFGCPMDFQVVKITREFVDLGDTRLSALYE